MITYSHVLCQAGPPSSPPSTALLRARTVTSEEPDHHRTFPHPSLPPTSTTPLSSMSQIQFNSLLGFISTRRLQNDWMGAGWWIQDSGFLWVKFPSLFYFMATLREVCMAHFSSLPQEAAWHTPSLTCNPKQQVKPRPQTPHRHSFISFQCWLPPDPQERPWELPGDYGDYEESRSNGKATL